jgi:hypothetical protein
MQQQLNCVLATLNFIRGFTVCSSDVEGPGDSFSANSRVIDSPDILPKCTRPRAVGERWQDIVMGRCSDRELDVLACWFRNCDWTSVTSSSEEDQ